MKKYYIYITAIVLMLYQLNVAAQGTVDDQRRSMLLDDSLITNTDTLVSDTLDWPKNLRSKIELLLQSELFKTSTVGLEIYDLTADSVLFCFNQQQRMRPASTMKVINAVASLDKLSGSHLFKTRLYYTGRVENNVLKGDVYCKGGFDPLFNTDDLRAFAESLHKVGIDTIKGNICADLSMKDSDLLGEGWCWDDDNPQLSPLLLRGKNNFMKNFCSELRRMGLVHVGDTLKADTPAKATELCNRFHTIDQILMKMMKKSDNLFAESLFYQLAASSGVYRASAKNAKQQINKLIKKLGFNDTDYYIADGSGLSLYNYVSPELLVAFLRYAYQNDNIFIHLLPSLPVAGVDGTLANRMTNGLANKNVKAKTGTLTGISSLAGYCTAANGHQLCFAIINMGVRKIAMGQRFQDNVCKAMCEQ